MNNKNNKGIKEGDLLNQVARFWDPEKGTKNPFNPLITLARKVWKIWLRNFVGTKQQTATYIHKSCRTILRNQIRPRKRESTCDDQQNSNKRICGGSFDFKTQCFYCEDSCTYDKMHPDQSKFVEVRTISTNIHKQTLDICKTRNDEKPKALETRLLFVNNPSRRSSIPHSMQNEFWKSHSWVQIPWSSYSLNKNGIFWKSM